MFVEKKRFIIGITVAVIACTILLLLPKICKYVVPFAFKFYINNPQIYIAAAGEGSFLKFVNVLSGLIGFPIGTIGILLLIKYWDNIKKSVRIFLFVVIIIISLMFFQRVLIECSGEYLRDLFKQKKDIIAPCECYKIEKIELKLNSLWRAMDSREQYRIINAIIYQCAQTNSEIKTIYLRFIKRHNFEIKIRGGK